MNVLQTQAAAGTPSFISGAAHDRLSIGRPIQNASMPPGNNALRLPNVFVVGAAKSGTTALYHYFKVHPQVIVPESFKEPNYMAFFEGLPPLSGPGDQKIVAKTSVTELADYLQLYCRRTTEPLAADTSPSYLYFRQAPSKIAEMCPGAKIVIVLRNPVEAAFSMYCMMRRDRREPSRAFREAFRRSSERLAAGWQWFWDLQSGWMYSRQVARYLSLFPREQLFIRRYEDLKHHPQKFYGELAGYLGINAIDVVSANQLINVAPRRGEMISKKRIGRVMLRAAHVAGLVLPTSWKSRIRQRVMEPPAYGLNTEDRRMLADHYSRDILELGAMLDWDLSDWLKV